MSETMLQARGLSKAFGRGEGLVRAVDEVDLEVRAGETVAVMGPSGCGKSTLLHMLGGLERPTAGEIRLAGQRVDQLTERALARLRRTAIGFVFQAFHLVDELTARENVELPTLLGGRSPRAAKRQAADLLERVGLADRAAFLPAALSGGQRQRVAIARALSNDPLVVLADEPTGNLDSAATLEVLRLFDTIGIVVGVALAVTAVATLVPAIRAARTSTVGALADSARPPRRRARVIAVTAWLPVPLLFGLRVAARRPRRMVLNALSIAVTTTGIVAVLMVHARFDASLGANAGLANPRDARLNQVMTVVSVALVVLAAVNAILITSATVLDARHSSALARALGATPQQVSAGLSAAQVLPALVGALLGIPGGIGLYSAVNKDGQPVTLPPVWWLVVTVLGTTAAVAAITLAPAWLGTRRPPGEVLQSELA
jgi:putative ABC transport system ATP-binding protein